MKKLCLTLVIVLLLVSICCGLDAKQVQSQNSNNSGSVTIPDFRKNPHQVDNFILVQGGTFQMGTPSGSSYSEPDEFPVHQVTLSSFYICPHEVTQGEYISIMDYNPSCFPQDMLFPVERVNWYNAIEYCNLLSRRNHYQPVYTYAGYGTNTKHWPHNWNTYYHNNIICDWSANGYRLPTEAEFEYAIRGGANHDNYTYSGSNNLNEVGWYQGNTTQTHEVMTKAPNSLGIYDMTGNVWEWLWDWFENYTSAPQTNPHGPDIAMYKDRRGGAWDGIYTYHRCTNRSYEHIMYGYWGMGFRVVRNAGE